MAVGETTAIKSSLISGKHFKYIPTIPFVQPWIVFPILCFLQQAVKTSQGNSVYKIMMSTSPNAPCLNPFTPRAQEKNDVHMHLNHATLWPYLDFRAVAEIRPWLEKIP